MTRVWSTWLWVWCGGVLVFGAVLTTAAIPGLDAAARALFGVFAHDDAAASTFALPAVRFGLGLQGALTIGWALTMIALFKAAHRESPELWRSFTIALLTWYAIDSAISIATGFWINAISNTAVAATYLVPFFGARLWRSVSA